MKITEQTWFPLSLVIGLVVFVGSGAWAASELVSEVKANKREFYDFKAEVAEEIREMRNEQKEQTRLLIELNARLSKRRKEVDDGN